MAKAQPPRSGGGFFLSRSEARRGEQAQHDSRLRRSRERAANPSVTRKLAARASRATWPFCSVTGHKRSQKALGDLLLTSRQP